MRKLLFGLFILFSLVVSFPAQTIEAEKIDEFEQEPCDYYLLKMDLAIDKAYRNPASTIYVLIYEGRERKYNARKNKTESVLPSVGSAAAKISSIKKYLKLRKFSVDRFAFVKAGFRENLTVEIWFVPTGASPPIPTPTLKSMKRRKGKALGFCTDCC